jgi:hypothetical protein
LREKYKKVLHVHHDLDLELTSSPKPKVGSNRSTYGSSGMSPATFASVDDEEDPDETSGLLQLRLELAGAQVRGVSMGDYSSSSSSRAMPEAFRSMGDLDAPHMHIASRKHDQSTSFLCPLVEYIYICVMHACKHACHTTPPQQQQQLTSPLLISPVLHCTALSDLARCVEEDSHLGYRRSPKPPLRSPKYAQRALLAAVSEQVHLYLYLQLL